MKARYLLFMLLTPILLIGPPSAYAAWSDLAHDRVACESGVTVVDQFLRGKSRRCVDLKIPEPRLSPRNVVRAPELTEPGSFSWDDVREMDYLANGVSEATMANGLIVRFEPGDRLTCSTFCEDPCDEHEVACVSCVYNGWPWFNYEGTYGYGEEEHFHYFTWTAAAAVSDEAAEILRR